MPSPAIANSHKVCSIFGHSHTKIEAVNAMGTQPIACQNVIEIMLSFSVSSFAMRIEIDQLIAAHKSNAYPIPIETSGRITTNIPMNPRMMAIHRLMPTRSDKNRTDKSVAKMGVVKRSVVASANEIMLRPVKTHSIPLPPIAPLMACSLNDDVENTFLP